MKLKIGDKVERRWKPALGHGVITHILGNKIVVTWYGPEKPIVEFEQAKYLRVLNESR